MYFWYQADSIMLSILIPVHNCNVTALVSSIHHQVQEIGVPFEICCMDDHSKQEIAQENLAIQTLPFTSYKISIQNNGREHTRQVLSEQASFDTLLFLDADTMPLHANFIKTYLEYVQGDYEAVFGGIEYEDIPPSQDKLLRWTYGKHNESRKAKERNKHLYQSITSPNFLIKKAVFESINSKIIGKDYGYDIYFAKLMRENNIKALHIDNEVLHLGLETSEDYLRKSEEALKTYLNLFRTGQIDSKDSKLLATFSKLKSLNLNYLISRLFQVYKKPIAKNLLGKRPSTSLFQLYRLSYLCHADITTYKQDA